MIKRERQADTGMVMVTFIQPNAGLDGSTSVVGDFNGWDPNMTTMLANGESRSASVIVTDGQRYRFRYLDHDAGWFNDEAADGYEPNDFGSDDSVVDLTRSAAPAQTPPATKKRRASKG